jgi:thioredoxin reductase/polyferredoxin
MIQRMFGWFPRYSHWLHTRWPAGVVEKLPQVNEDGTCAIPGVRIVGDLTGIPLLKFAVDSGAKAARAIAHELDPQSGIQNQKPEILDLAIIGGGVAGVAAAVEARKHGLRFALYEASAPFFTIANFPKGKPIYTYPTNLTPEGDFQVSAETKESLLAEMDAQRTKAGIEFQNQRVERLTARGDVLDVHLAGGSTVQARRIIVAIGRSGNFRKLGCPGEDLPKVSNRLHDPKDYAGKNVLVVGGGDSALEAAIALTACGAHTTLSYRKKDFSRPKPDNLAQIQRLSADPTAPAQVEQPTSERVTTAADSDMRGNAAPGSLRLALGTEVASVGDSTASLRGADGRMETIPNDQVFAMIGREAPLEFFRRSGIPIRGEWRARDFAWMGAFLIFCTWLYHWKGGKELPFLGKLPAWLNWNPAGLWTWIQSHLPTAADPATLLGTLKISASGPSFYYTLAYSIIIVVFGLRRIRRRKTPYVQVQTLSLMAFQCLPLFLLPEIILPLLGHNGFFDHGWLKSVADEFFPIVTYNHGREYWRAYGLILAWPLFVYNAFTSQPMWGWLIVGFLQTFVLIPFLVWKWGKGAYCGWICSCGALAETLGDQHRHKMPHGPFWNRLNMLGQGVLAFAAALMLLRILGWLDIGWAKAAFDQGFKKIPLINYSWFIDLLMAGILGYGFYFWYSGRVWCRFACPLAALMHIYARFSRFRIFAEKSKCISCNVCTSVCHQGIDIMNFANKGLPMQDPECVRCSACVQQCPTGVLAFGRTDALGLPVLDRLAASPVRMRESGPPPKRTE